MTLRSCSLPDIDGRPARRRVRLAHHRVVDRGAHQVLADEPSSYVGKHRDEPVQHAFVHTVEDDRSRVAYAEIHDDEPALTAAGVLRRAVF